MLIVKVLGDKKCVMPDTVNILFLQLFFILTY